MTCVSKEYEINTKMVLEQWLQLKMTFLLGCTLKMLFGGCGEIDFWCVCVCFFFFGGGGVCGGGRLLGGGFLQVGGNEQILAGGGRLSPSPRR